MIEVLISFEGSDGCGKSTQCRLLLEYLQCRGEKVVLTREPGGTLLSEKVRSLLLDGGIECSNNTAVLLFCAARAQLVDEVIKPALSEGVNIIMDRGVDSTLLYQCLSRGVSDTELKRIWGIIMFSMEGIVPDITFLLKRNVTSDLLSSRDRFEAKGVGFQCKINSHLEDLLTIDFIKPDRFRVIDGNRDPLGVFDQVRRYIDAIKML